MSTQADISAKATITCTGSDAAVTYKARGVTLSQKVGGNQIANYRLVLDSAVPESDTLLRVSSGPRPSPKGKTPMVPGWLTDMRFSAPVMESITTNGDLDGYTAQPKVLDTSGIWITVNRSDRMSDANMTTLLNQVIYMLANDATLRSAILAHDVIS